MTNKPVWADALIDAADRAGVADLTRMTPPPGATPKKAAVLMLFAGSSDNFDDAQVLFVQRRQGLRKHSGHVAFPGGSIEDVDENACDAALRETHEETHITRDRIDVIAQLPELFLAATHYNVTPMVGWAPTPPDATAGSPEEIESVHWVRVGDLLDPAHRVSTRLTSRLTGPAFVLPGLFIWGFTAGLFSRFVDLAGFGHPWDATRIVDVPAAQKTHRR